MKESCITSIFLITGYFSNTPENCRNARLTQMAKFLKPVSSQLRGSIIKKEVSKPKLRKNSWFKTLPLCGEVFLWAEVAAVCTCCCLTKFPSLPVFRIFSPKLLFFCLLFKSSLRDDGSLEAALAKKGLAKREGLDILNSRKKKKKSKKHTHNNKKNQPQNVTCWGSSF